MISPRTEVIVTQDGEVIASRIVEPGDYVIGRDADCGIVAAIEGVSRRHAMLTVNYGDMFIEDLGSANGTVVAGQPIAAPVRLWPGQSVQMGAATLTTRRLRSEENGDSLLPWTAELRKQLPEELRREGRYAINSLVAQGGMGAILDARDQTIRRTVAMKVMLDPRFQDDMVRFIEEAQVTGQLEHPNIVPIYELGVDAHEQVFYTMKFVRGITLKKVLELLASGTAGTIQKYSLAALLTVFQKVCDAIAFAHSRGVIHRDLKPENVMIGDFGEVLVMDWGLAKTLHANGAAPSMIHSARTDSGESGATMAGMIMGTPNFMAPEQAEGRIADLDARTDIFALGGILYSILTLQAPFTGTTVEEVLKKVIRGTIVAPVSFNTTKGRTPKPLPSTKDGGGKPAAVLAHLPAGRVPESLSAVAMKAMALLPADRYQSVPELQKDIEAHQGGFATGAERAGAWKQFVLLVKRNKTASIGLAAVLLVGSIFGTKAFIEGRRAERTLGELRGTAPTFEAQSRALLADGNLEEALAKIGYAVTLAPESADYHLARAHLFQSTQKLSEAEDEYRRVLALRPGDPQARANLDLCGKLLAENAGKAELPLNLQSKLLSALVAQHRDLEAAPLAKLLNRDSQTAEATIRARLASYTTQKGWKKDNIRRQGKGFWVELSTLQLGDLNALRGLPIVELRLNQTSVTDLRPLAELPLDVLTLINTHVSDLSPLRGMKFRILEIANTDVSDLSPLSGMPLKYLNLWNCTKLHDLKPLAGLPLEKLDAGMLAVTDITALRGMPLREAFFHHPDLRGPDFSPLAHSQTLEKISLPWEIKDISFLATMPNLQQVELHGYGKPETWMPVRDFLAMYGPDVPEIKAARAALAIAGVKDLPIWRVAVDPDHRLRVSLLAMPLTDLVSLRGLPIKKLNLGQTGVGDLEPLRGMPLTDLSITSTKVRNLEPLRGMPLVTLRLGNSLVRDVGILADFHDLEEIELARDSTNIERLRTLPKLRYLATSWDKNANHPAQTAEQFWKEYAAKQAAGKK